MIRVSNIEWDAGIYVSYFPLPDCADFTTEELELYIDSDDLRRVDEMPDEDLKYLVTQAILFKYKHTFGGFKMVDMRKRPNNDNNEYDEYMNKVRIEIENLIQIHERINMLRRMQNYT